MKAIYTSNINNNYNYTSHTNKANASAIDPNINISNDYTNHSNSHSKGFNHQTNNINNMNINMNINKFNYTDNIYMENNDD